MTTQEIINYYANLLILQYLGLESNYAAIQTLVTPVIMDQLPTQVMNAFNLTGDDVAEGVQLDVLGKYAGVARTGIGFTGSITLDDDEFLSLIQMAIVRNSSGSSLSDISSLLHMFFPGQILPFDYANMHMSYLVSSTVGSQELIQLFVTEGLLPKPMGVTLSLIIYADVIDRFFGFRTYLTAPTNNTPFNSYTDYDMDSPWLSYANAIT